MEPIFPLVNNNANNNNQGENHDTIERVLRRSERDFNLTVESIVCTAGSQVGDNYMSVVKRVKVRGRMARDQGNTSR